MNPYFIAADNDTTPEISMDPAKGHIEVKGWSHPEDAIRFYNPVMDWIRQYEAAPAPKTDVHFRFQYYNTASAKQIFRIISELENVAKKSKVAIHWYYEPEDDDMHHSGERLARMTTLPFQFISGPVSS